VLVGNQRLYMAQTQQIDLQQNLRAAATILPAEFRELDAADGDIKSPLSATSITMRAMRKLAFICGAPNLAAGLGTITITVRQAPMLFGRNLTWTAGQDSVLVFYDGRGTTRNDDTWLPARVTGSTPVTCVDSTGVLNPATQLSLQPNWLASLNPPANGIPWGSPVRGFDNVTYAVYQSSSDQLWYVGYRNNSRGSGMQPIIGPLTGSNGLELGYFDVNGNVTTDTSKVAQIEIHVRAMTAAPIRTAGAGVQAYKVDSFTTRVALRNNPRCGPGSPTAPAPCN